MNMNLEATPQTPLNYSVSNLAPVMKGGEIFGDIEDITSSWHEMRLAEMNGVDYLFVPALLSEHLQSPAALQDFLMKAQFLVDTSLERVSIITFSNNLNPKFERYTVQWQSERARSFTVQNLEHSPQAEFIRILFDHSEDLILSR